VAAALAERAPTERLLIESSLPTDFDDDPAGQFPERCLWRFLDLAARRLDCPEFGLIAGARAQLEDLGTFGRRLGQSLTLFHLLETLGRAVRQVSSHARFWLVRSNDATWFCREGMREVGGLDVGRREAEHWTLMFMLHLIHRAAGQSWQPPRVLVQCGSTKALADGTFLGGTELWFDQEVTAIALPPAVLIRPVRSADARNGLTSRLRSELRPTLRAGHAPIDAAAEIAGVSPRTLQRRLDAEGLTYSRLVDQVRFAAAARMLQESDAPLIEIAFDVGYSDPAHFTRAFRRWTGTTPRAFRREQHLAAG
jgi:AraC-like DNA-binding protein